MKYIIFIYEYRFLDVTNDLFDIDAYDSERGYIISEVNNDNKDIVQYSDNFCTTQSHRARPLHGFHQNLRGIDLTPGAPTTRLL